MVQVSQYTFAMCSYREKKAEPHELMQLDGYTVDYAEPHPGTALTAPTATHIRMPHFFLQPWRDFEAGLFKSGPQFQILALFLVLQDS